LISDDNEIIAGFAMGAGEMSRQAFTGFLRLTLGHAAACCRDGAIAFVCMDWRHLGELLAAGQAVFSELKNLCVWNKTNGGMGSFYRSKHELVLVFKIGNSPHTNTFGLGDSGRYRTNGGTMRASIRCDPGALRTLPCTRRSSQSRCRRRHQGLLPARRNRARPLRRLGHHAHCRREDRSTSTYPGSLITVSDGGVVGALTQCKRWRGAQVAIGGSSRSISFANCSAMPAS
jgi:hypothetical protein